jgi:hypothetical protein
MFGESADEQFQSVGLLSHQVAFVDAVISAVPPARFLLVAPPGFGKSQAISSAVRILTSRNTTPTRCLVIVPAAVQAVWAALLHGIVGVEPMVVNAPVYRLIQAETPSEQNPWATHPCIVTSIDFLKKGQRVEEAVGVPWDLVVLDEVQWYTVGTERGNAAQQIWEADRVSVAIAASTSPEQVDWLMGVPQVRVFRWGHEAIRDWDDTRNVPGRRVETTTYKVSAPEQEFGCRFNDFLDALPEKPAVGLMRTILLGRWRSSPYAVEQSLRRTLIGAESLTDYSREAEDLSAEYVPDDEIDPSSLPYETDWDVQQCQGLLHVLEQIAEDSKWAACESLLRGIRVGEERSIVLFTEFVDTAEYVSSLAQSSGWRTHLISGAVAVDERQQAVLSAQSEPSVLIVTTGTTEGLNLSITDHVLHYDISERPEALLRRYGACAYSGSRFPLVYHHFLVAEGSVERSILDRLLDKVDGIEQMFGRR